MISKVLAMQPTSAQCHHPKNMFDINTEPLCRPESIYLRVIVTLSDEFIEHLGPCQE